jgi:hypothetical protein
LLRCSPEGKDVKRISIIAALLLALACRVEKTGKDTYKVVTPTPEAKAAAQKATEKAREVTHEASEAIAKKTEPTGTSSTETTATTETTTTVTTKKKSKS